METINNKIEELIKEIYDTMELDIEWAQDWQKRSLKQDIKQFIAANKYLIAKEVIEEIEKEHRYATSYGLLDTLYRKAEKSLAN